LAKGSSPELTAVVKRVRESTAPHLLAGPNTAAMRSRASGAGGSVARIISDKL
jgi:hypothetical protein